jgi:hypothetical protein
MSTISDVLLKPLAMTLAATLFTAPVSAGILDKIKIIEKTATMVTKPPKVQADVGGVKIDATSCSAKTGVKTIDNATKSKSKDKCGLKKKKEEPAKVVEVKSSQPDEDDSTDR